MAVSNKGKRKFEPSSRARLPSTKKFKKQRTYASDSSDESYNEGKFVARDAPRNTEIDQPLTKKNLPKTTRHKTAKSGNKPPSEEDESELELEADAALDEMEGESLNEEEVGEEETEEGSAGEDKSDESEGSESGSSVDSDGGPPTGRKKQKRHDPGAFANSLSTILSSKLPSSKRVDPVLARSKDALIASHELAESKLEARARRKIREEKRVASEKGRVRDVLLGDAATGSLDTIDSATEDSKVMSAAAIAEHEKRLKRTAQRGVIQLFNAVRAAQVKGEEAAQLVREKGVVGQQKREKKIGDMGRDAFLEMVGAGTKSS